MSNQDQAGRERDKGISSEVERLLWEARLALDFNDLPTAVGRLKQASELRPDDFEIAEQYAEVERRRRLLDELRRIENEAQDLRERGSLAETRDRLRQGLQLFLRPTVALPPEAKKILSNLLTLAEQEGGLALGSEEYWSQTQDMLDRLSRMSNQGWEAFEASRLVVQWAELIRDQWLQRVINVYTQLEQYPEAYRAVWAYLNRHPTDKEAVQQLAWIMEKPLNQVGESIAKRLRTARKAQERGDYETALEQLTELFQYYQELDDEFPDLLRGHDEIEHTRQEAAELEQQVRELQRIQAEVLPHLEAAEKAFWEDRLEEAEALFRSLPRLGLVTRLAQRIQALEEHLTAARRQAQIRQARQTLSQARFDLGMAQTIQDVERIRQDLEDLTHKVDLFDLPPEEQARYDQIAAEIGRLQIGMMEGQAWEEQAQDHLAHQRYQAALQALEKALAVARDPAKRVYLQSEQGKISRLTDSHPA